MFCGTDTNIQNEVRSSAAHCLETLCFSDNKKEVDRKTEQNVNLEERFF